jgi:YHS domain-containing protein
VSVLLGTSLFIAAQDGHQMAHNANDKQPSQENAGPHGGTLQTVGQKRIETVLEEKGIMFMILSSDSKPVAFPSATGTLKLRVGESKTEYTYQLKALKNHAIGVGVDLSKVIDRQLHMNVQINNAGSEPLVFHAVGKLASGKLSDELLISLQATCPVSGQPLGSMGKPPKITIGDKSLFVCCAGCTKKVESSPERYFTKYYTAKGEQVREGVFKSTLADADAIAAQKTCPVMDEPLGGMGVPLKVAVKGKAVYICCAGCAKKLRAEPDRFLAKLDEKGVTPPVIP